MRELTGGCQCGRVRYRAQVADDEAYLCHCRMCQRATGGVSIAFKNLPQADVAWDREPYGTPLGFTFNDGENIDLTVGSFDDPAVFYPTEHSGSESLHEGWLDTTALPRHRSDENANVTRRWAEAGLKVPM